MHENRNFQVMMSQGNDWAAGPNPPGDAIPGPLLRFAQLTMLFFKEKRERKTSLLLYILVQAVSKRPLREGNAFRTTKHSYLSGKASERLLRE